MGNAASTPHMGTPPPASDSSPAPPSTAPKEPAAPPSPAPPQTPLLLPYAGHLSPQNPHCLSHPQAHDYSKTAVTSLIIDQQLAPFYRGLDDFEEDWALDDVRRELDETIERDYQADINNSATHRLKEEREGGKPAGSAEDRAERLRRETRAYLGAVECPICFLNYPPNINTSRCCQQPLCTECFVQIKRGEATLTHIESESACCPYCVETDFGVIYERPSPIAPTPVNGASASAISASAIHLGSSPEPNASGFSQALSLSEDPHTGSGSTSPAPPVPPKETVRRKSVSSKAKEVVTIDQIRPDWETKLNAVKAAAARRAARRIVMRQVGDRLIPIGYTSSRATGLADFSMSVPQAVEDGGSRRSRRARGREREMEEMMIMEAMRLSLLDHEEHQRKIDEDERRKREKDTKGKDKSTPVRSGAGTPTPSSSRRSSSAGTTLSSWRSASGSGGGEHGRAQAAASKLLSKITVNRSRANSKSSVHFAPSPTTLGESSTNSPTPGELQGRARSSSTPSPMPRDPPEHHVSPLAQGEMLAPQPLRRTVIPATPDRPASAEPESSASPEEGAKVTEFTNTSASRVTAAEAVPTAANPHPDLAALMGEALGDDSNLPAPLIPSRLPAPVLASIMGGTIVDSPEVELRGDPILASGAFTDSPAVAMRADPIAGSTIVDTPAVEMRADPIVDQTPPAPEPVAVPTVSAIAIPAPHEPSAVASVLSSPPLASPAAVSTLTAQRDSIEHNASPSRTTPQRMESNTSVATSTWTMDSSVAGEHTPPLQGSPRPTKPLAALENDDADE